MLSGGFRQWLRLNHFFRRFRDPHCSSSQPWLPRGKPELARDQMSAHDLVLPLLPACAGQQVRGGLPASGASEPLTRPSARRRWRTAIAPEGGAVLAGR